MLKLVEERLSSVFGGCSRQMRWCPGGIELWCGERRGDRGHQAADVCLDICVCVLFRECEVMSVYMYT